MALLLGAYTIQTVFFTLQTMSMSPICSERVSKSCCSAAHDGASKIRSSAYASTFYNGLIIETFGIHKGFLTGQ